jgi:hypothetical protein
VGLHQPSDAQHFDAAFVSVNRLRTRKGPSRRRLDHGQRRLHRDQHARRLPHAVASTPREIRRWNGNGRLLAAVRRTGCASRIMLEKTGCRSPSTSG